MSTATYKNGWQALLNHRSIRIDKSQPKVRLRFMAVKKIVTGARLLNQKYPPQEQKPRILKEIRWARFLAMLVSLNLPASAFAQSSCLGIHVKIPDLENRTGNIACGIFNTPGGFPKQFLDSAETVIIKKIQGAQAQCDFADIPPGTYAIAVIHDENRNGELDTNWFGLPTEGYGFSNTTVDEFGAPAFSAASFRYDGRNLNLSIKLKY